MNKKRKKFLCNPYIIGMVGLVVVTVLVVYGAVQVRNKILYDMGSTLVESYASGERESLNKFVEYAEFAYQYVEKQEQSGETTENIQLWLKDYFETLSPLIGEDIFTCYAVIDGEFIATNGWEGADGYAYWEKQWYRDALAADGDIIISDGYTDAATGETVFTVAKKLSRTGDMILIDIYVSNPKVHSSLQSLPEGSAFYICDAQGTVLYSRSQLTDSIEEAQQLANQMLSDIHNGKFSQYGARLKGPDGTWYGVYYSELELGWTVLITLPLGSYLLSGDNNAAFYALAAVFLVFLVLLLFLFILDRKKTEKMQEDSEIISVLGNSFAGIVRIDMVAGSYKTLKMPKKMSQQIPGKGDYPVLLRALCETLPPDDRQECEQSFSLESICQRAKEGISDYGKDVLQQKDGKNQWINIRTIQVPDVMKHEVIWCFRDVDAEKRRELQHTILLKDALDTAQKSSKAKAVFFSNMSHDMRTPLNAVIGCTSLAREALHRQQSDKMEAYLEKIEYAGNQLLGLVNDILELSKLEAGKNAIEETTFDMELLLSETVDMFRDMIKEDRKTISLTTDMKNQIVEGDKKKLGQILNNLLSNAVKYTNPGDTIRVEVRQFDFKTHSKYQMIVADTGIGMSQDFLAHLFDPYSREITYAGTSNVGIGLGMTIVKGLVQQLSGEISVDSTLGEGSSFTVTIPLKVAEISEGTEYGEGVPLESYNWHGSRILLVEDNELNMEIASSLLELHGAQVIRAYNGLEAVQIFEESLPYSIDLILMDMQMPEMDGCEAAKAIRELEHEYAKTIPIIAVTANAFAEDIAKTTNAGMNAHVAKPMDFAVLSQTAFRVVGAKSKKDGPGS